MRGAAARWLAALAGAALAACAAPPERAATSERAPVEARALETEQLTEFANHEEVVAFAQELAAREHAHNLDKHPEQMAGEEGLMTGSFRKPAPPWLSELPYAWMDRGAIARPVGRKLVVLDHGRVRIFRVRRSRGAELRAVSELAVTAADSGLDIRWDDFFVRGDLLLVVGVERSGRDAFASFEFATDGSLARREMLLWGEPRTKGSIYPWDIHSDVWLRGDELIFLAAVSLAGIVRDDDLLGFVRVGEAGATEPFYALAETRFLRSEIRSVHPGAELVVRCKLPLAERGCSATGMFIDGSLDSSHVGQSGAYLLAETWCGDDEVGHEFAALRVPFGSPVGSLLRGVGHPLSDATRGEGGAFRFIAESERRWTLFELGPAGASERPLPKPARAEQCELGRLLGAHVLYGNCEQPGDLESLPGIWTLALATNELSFFASEGQVEDVRVTPEGRVVVISRGNSESEMLETIELSFATEPPAAHLTRYSSGGDFFEYVGSREGRNVVIRRRTSESRPDPWVEDAFDLLWTKRAPGGEYAVVARATYPAMQVDPDDGDASRGIWEDEFSWLPDRVLRVGKDREIQQLVIGRPK